MITSVPSRTCSPIVRASSYVRCTAKVLPLCRPRIRSVPVPDLSPPTTAVWQSFRAALAEFAAEGRGSEHDDTMIGADLCGRAETLATPDGFAEYVAALHADALEETPRREGWVPCST